MDLETNQIDAVFVDEVLANYYIATNNKNYNQIEQALKEEQYAIGF
ncbi:MAG: transporter substrate-binding domain-containing protein [Clostridia bacterium]